MKVKQSKPPKIRVQFVVKRRMYLYMYNHVVINFKFVNIISRALALPISSRLWVPSMHHSVLSTGPQHTHIVQEVRLSNIKHV